MERFLITGVNGFVGQHFLKYLESFGNKVKALGVDCVSSGYKPVNYSYQFELADFINTPLKASVVSAFRPDYVVHLAAKSSVSECQKNPNESIAFNVKIQLNLFQTLSDCRCSNCRVLLVSSSEVYAPPSKPLVETGKCNPANAYGIAKLIGEFIIRFDNFFYGNDFMVTDTVIARSFMHIGPEQSERFAIASFVKQLVHAKQENKSIAKLKTGNVDIARDITDVRDVIRAYHLLLKHGRNKEVYNVCSGAAIKLSEVINMASEIIGIPVEIVIDKQRVRSDDPKIIVGDNKKLRETTGWKPEIKLSQTLKDMIDCYS
ncbi:MAG: GDP-mannose 4,6-dehydratase [Planctomycetaceae bacterium]|jgi:GDP-4-dehydro-6-deoxy-D-mannose reductase|nr:GDP-mannose 4,6-dehydratase [Planctomycetaceae bacterium]